MTVSVRPAEPRDFEAVTSLLAELGRPKVLGGGEEVEHRRRFEAWLSDPDLDAFVGEIDGEVAGFIDLAFVQRLNFGAPQAWVPDLIVREHARSRGVGAALLARVERAARERGAFALTLESANWRTRAHAFYLRQGMADEAKEFVRVLTEVGWPPPPPPPESEPRGPTRPS